ncbi:MAG TPA: hypothetical protein VFD70_21105 [Anaerolineae bacterium]|nr:hypothetical protein [Anaerolineae bacterium]
MFEFKLKPGIVPTASPLSEQQRRTMFVLHKNALKSAIEGQSHYLLVTGGTGLGKTTFIDAWIADLEEKAKQKRRSFITIRFTPHMSDNSELQLKYLSGKLKIKSPDTGNTVTWNVALNPKVKIPPFVKIDFKVEAKKSKENSRDYPLDQQARDAREQLAKLASKKNPPLIGKPPLIVVTIEKLTEPVMLGAIKEIFDANASLPWDNQIYFLVSGNLNLHTVWWIQKASDDGLMTQFTDIYLQHIWSLRGFCEQVIDGSSVSEHKLLSKFANYLAIESTGNLRAIWSNLQNASDHGVQEDEINRYDRLYNLFFQDDPLTNTFAASMSLIYSQGEYTDRLRWAVATFIKWFAKKWLADERTINETDISAIAAKLEPMIPEPELRGRVISALFG